MKRRDEKVHVLVGDRGIVAAVLLQALADVREGNPRLAAPAAAWIHSDREDHPLAFVRICESLDLDASGVRRTIRRFPPMRTPPPGDDDELREDPEA